MDNDLIPYSHPLFRSPFTISDRLVVTLAEMCVIYYDSMTLTVFENHPKKQASVLERILAIDF